MSEEEKDDKSKRKLKVVDPAAHEERLRLWLERFVQEHPHLDTSVLQRREWIGVSRTALDAYIKGTYFLEKEKGGQGVDPRRSDIEDRIRAFRDKTEGTSRHGYGGGFIETATWRYFQLAAETATNENAIVVVYGKPGAGKTRCLKEYRKRKVTTAPVEIFAWRNISTRFFGQLIAREIGLDDGPPRAELEYLIAQKIRKSPRPIIVDQANYLDERGLGTICYIWDEARIPILLIGTRDLYEMFVTSRLTEDVREQLKRRVKMFYQLPVLSHTEGAALVKKAIGDGATDAVIARFLSETGGVFGLLEDAVNETLKMRGNGHGKLKLEQIVARACSKVTGAEEGR